MAKTTIQREDRWQRLEHVLVRSKRPPGIPTNLSADDFGSNRLNWTNEKYNKAVRESPRAIDRWWCGKRFLLCHDINGFPIEMPPVATALGLSPPVSDIVLCISLICVWYRWILYIYHTRLNKWIFENKNHQLLDCDKYKLLMVHYCCWDIILSSVCYFIVRRAGLLWSQQDFEWRWSVPLFKCLTVLEFSFILFDLCLLITFFNFIMNYVPIVTFWIFTYHKIWILSIMFCFIWSYWIIYFLACLEVSWRVVS